MATSLDQKIAQLPEDRRAHIDVRTDELIAEELFSQSPRAHLPRRLLALF